MILCCSDAINLAKDDFEHEKTLFEITEDDWITWLYRWCLRRRNCNLCNSKKTLINASVEKDGYYWIMLPQRSRTGIIYYIQDTGGGAVKIGYSRDPKTRLNGMQVGNPNELILLGGFQARKEMEKELHKSFSNLNIRGEWFKPKSDFLLKTLQLLSEKGFITNIPVLVSPDIIEVWFNEKCDKTQKLVVEGMTSG